MVESNFIKEEIDMKKLYYTEIEYLKSFSEYYEDSLIMRFRDRMIEDMYSHNLTYIKHDIKAFKFQNIIQNEIIQSIKLGKNFLNVQFDFPYRTSMLDKSEKQPSEITSYDYYLFSIEQLSKLKVRNDLNIRKLDDSILKQALKLDLDANGEDMGIDFIKRRFERRSKVYLQSGMVDNYICFHGNEAVGHCDLFINDTIAKIEDFDVAPDKQRKGYGTVILKEMIRTSISNGADTIYLITDHDDTAKDMYEKCGFSKVSTKTKMLYLL